MDLKTYITLTKTVSFLRGAISTDLEDWVNKICAKVADDIETAIADDLPFELRSK